MLFFITIFVGIPHDFLLRIKQKRKCKFNHFQGYRIYSLFWLQYSYLFFFSIKNEDIKNNFYIGSLKWKWKVATKTIMKQRQYKNKLLLALLLFETKWSGINYKSIKIISYSHNPWIWVMTYELMITCIRFISLAYLVEILKHR